MNINRKNFLFGLFGIGVAGVGIEGCTTIPTIDTIKSGGIAVGKAAGFVVKNIEIDENGKRTIAYILKKAQFCIPTGDETFEGKWGAIAKEHIGILVSRGDIDEKKGELLYSAFVIILKGVEYLFAVRYPAAKAYTDLAVNGIAGFVEGFIMVYGDDQLASRKNIREMVDMDAYRYLYDLVPVNVRVADSEK